MPKGQFVLCSPSMLVHFFTVLLEIGEILHMKSNVYWMSGLSVSQVAIPHNSGYIMWVY